MIHISVKHRELREKIELDLNKKSYEYKSYFSGMKDKDILRLKDGDIIVGRLSIMQFFRPIVDVELWIPWNDKFLRFLLTAVDFKGINPCMIFLGEEKDI